MRILQLPVIGAVAAVGALLCPPTTAQAQTQELFACYVPNSGVVYRVNPPGAPGESPDLKDDCTGEKHVKFSWAALAVADGKVGIGTDNPTVALDVAGDIHASGELTIGNTIIISDEFNSINSSGPTLELRVGGKRALKLQATTGVNVIGGFVGNAVLLDREGATIGGGGEPGNPNRLTGSFGTVSGGKSNTASNVSATVGGGSFNTASARTATVGGGSDNEASGVGAIVGGGFLNVASGIFATVGGGANNEASGGGATVPGGGENVAGGTSSFAAGRRAKISELHDGTFVWADDTFADFASTGANQFLIRATGGVGIGTASPGEQLTVVGTIESTLGGFKFPDGTTQTSAAAAGGVPGYEIVTAQVLVSGGAEGTLNAVCPTGKKATGGGFAMGTGLVERENHPGTRPGGGPSTFGEAWFVRAFNPTGSQLLVTAYAVCATV